MKKDKRVFNTRTLFLSTGYFRGDYMDITIEVAVELIKDYMEKTIKGSSLYFNKKWFVERSYARWAAVELMLKMMNYCYDCPSKVSKYGFCDVYELIDDFILQMQSLLSVKRNRAFVVAVDTAEAIKRYLKKTSLI